MLLQNCIIFVIVQNHFAQSKLIVGGIPIIVNLNEHLLPLQQCLIQMTNHKKVDLPFINVPTIMRKYNTKKWPTKHLEIMEVPKHTVPKYFAFMSNNLTIHIDLLGNILDNQTASLNSQPFKCNSSIYLHGGPDLAGPSEAFYNLCIKINYFQFSTQIRPWKCEAFIDLLPPTDKVRQWDPHHGNNVYKPMDYWFWETAKYNFGPVHLKNSRIAPHSLSRPHIPRLYILVSNTGVYFLNKEVVYGWLFSNWGIIRRPFGRLEIFLFLRTKLIPEANHRLIYKTYIPSYFEKWVEYDPDKILSIPDIFACGGTEEHVSLARTYLNSELQCKLYKTSKNSKDLFRTALKTAPVASLFELGYDKMWQSVIQNSSDSDPCNFKNIETWQIKRIQMEERVVSNTTIPPQFPPTVYRFVSCGRSSNENLPFNEFLISFDIPTWICIFILIFILIPAILSIHMSQTFAHCFKEQFFKHLVSSFKMIVEQGMPIPANMSTNCSKKWLLSTSLLGCLVLTNWYKRDNMLKIVQPRDKLPFHKFSQLVENNFTVYTRASRISYSKNCKRNLSKCYSFSMHQVNPHQYENNYGLYARSDVLRFGIDNQNSYEMIQRNSKLLPEAMSKQYAILVQEAKNWNLGMVKFLEKQSELILMELVQCDKKAAIFPETIVREIELELRMAIPRSNKDDKVYVGREKLFQSGYHYYILQTFHTHALVPKSIQERLNWYRQSGILEAWKKLIKWVSEVKRHIKLKGKYGGASLGARHKVLKYQEKTAMDGNIRVIFALLSYGLFISLLVIVLENHYELYNFVKIVLNVFSRKIIWIRRKFHEFKYKNTFKWRKCLKGKGKLEFDIVKVNVISTAPLNAYDKSLLYHGI